MPVRFAAAIKPRQGLQCPACLFSFRGEDCFARCENGCKATETATGAYTGPLIFNPREAANRAKTAAAAVSATCPRCQRPTACWVCPACRADLPAEGASERVASLVFVGPSGAGKSTLARVALQRLESQHATAAGFALDPWDKVTRDAWSPPAASKIEHAPSTLRFRLVTGGAHRGLPGWLSVFDTPGEPWEDRDEHYLNSANVITAAQVVILVIDPTRFAPVDAALRKRAAASWRPGVRAAVEAYPRKRLSPVDEIRHLSTFFGRRGLPMPSRTALGVVLTKLDLWAPIAPEGTLLRCLANDPPPAGLNDTDLEQVLHDEVEALLVEWGGETFVQQLDLKFPENRCFAVSALGAAADAPADLDVPPAPFGVDPVVEWALGRQGMRLRAS